MDLFGFCFINYLWFWFSTGSLVPRWKAAMLKPNNSYDFFWKSNFSDVQMSASKALRNNSFELCSRPLIDSASNTRHRQMSSHISRQWVGTFLISSTHPECQDPGSTDFSYTVMAILTFKWGIAIHWNSALLQCTHSFSDSWWNIAFLDSTAEYDWFFP